MRVFCLFFLSTLTLSAAIALPEFSSIEEKSQGQSLSGRRAP